MGEFPITDDGSPLAPQIPYIPPTTSHEGKLTANGNRTGVHSSSPRPLPHGVADYFWADAVQRKELEFALFELYRQWGYNLIIPPTFEYADTFYARAGQEFQNEMYRFPDKDGTMLALRPEMTIPVARLVATRLHDVPMPHRYFYMGSVFRYIEPQAGRQREFFQAGVELIGALPPEADAEVVAVTAAAVETAGITAYQLVLGQLGYFDALLSDLNLNPAQSENLRQAIDRNSEPQLVEFLTATPLRTQQRRTLEALPGLRGEDPYQVIAGAERHALNARMYNALTTLRSICQALEGYGLLDKVYVDLTEINNLGYYTGLSFEILTPETGHALGSGGRYDTLLASFGHDHPAVGAALGIDRMLHARLLQAGTGNHRRPIAPKVVVDTGRNPACLPIVRRLRASGLHVTVHLDTPATQAGRGATDESPSTRDAYPDSVFLEWTGHGFRVEYPSRAVPAREFELADLELLVQSLTQPQDPAENSQ